MFRCLKVQFSIRQENDILGVVLGSPKDYTATEGAPSGRFVTDRNVRLSLKESTDG